MIEGNARQRVFDIIAASGSDGITEAQIVLRSQLPTDTVWNALRRLRSADKIVRKRYGDEGWKYRIAVGATRPEDNRGKWDRQRGKETV